MATENALGFLRAVENAKTLPKAIVIAGPHGFLREHCLAAAAERLARDGFHYRSHQIANANDAARAADELRENDLFAKKRLLVCRVMRSFRERGGGDSESEESSGASRGSDAPIVDAIGEDQGANHLVVVYERDSAPAKAKRAAESAGMLVNCLRPFDNQLPQYAQLFARRIGMRLSRAAAEQIVSRHAGDLAAIANSLSKLAIAKEPDATIEPRDLADTSATKAPDLFEIAESFAAGKTAAAVAQVARALAVGRDPVELLSLEIIPVMRRMMIAASMLAARRNPGEIAGSLGLNPSSPLATRAIEGAKRFGVSRLTGGYRRAIELDAQFKNGEIRDREEALHALIVGFGASA